MTRMSAGKGPTRNEKDPTARKIVILNKKKRKGEWGNGIPTVLGNPWNFGAESGRRWKGISLGKERKSGKYPPIFAEDCYPALSHRAPLLSHLITPSPLNRIVLTRINSYKLETGGATIN